ncbi:MAG: hypothetical protein JJE39_11780 [Vicinamibacteria bacterium]|nr:hypothetical protein [Vicinamibacteria bacterium]
MKRASWLGSAILWIFLTAAFGRAEQTPSDTKSPEVSQQKQEKIAALETELDRLRAEMAGLQKELERLRSQAAKADDQGMAARIAVLEATQVKIETELARIAEELRLIGDALDQVSENDRKRPTMTVYGTLQATKYNQRDSILDAEAFELVLSGRPHPRLSFFAEIEFERAASVGGPRGGEIVIEQAYASYTFAQLFSIRSGVLLVPFGNVNVDHFAPLRDVVRKPLVSFAIAPSDWTDNGVQISGRRLLGTTWLLEYEAAVIAGLDSHITSVGAREARQAFGVDNNGNKATVGRFAIKRGGSFETGLSGYTGNYDDLNRWRLKGWAADLRAEVGPLRLTGEFDHFTADRGVLASGQLTGYYVRASYDIRGGFLKKLAKDFDDPRLTFVAQFDWATIEGPTVSDSLFEKNRETGVTLGFAYRPSRQWVLKVNYETNTATNQTLDRGTLKGWLASIGFVF